MFGSPDYKHKRGFGHFSDPGAEPGGSTKSAPAPEGVGRVVEGFHEPGGLDAGK